MARGGPPFDCHRRQHPGTARGGTAARRRIGHRQPEPARVLGGQGVRRRCGVGVRTCGRSIKTSQNRSPDDPGRCEDGPPQGDGTGVGGGPPPRGHQPRTPRRLSRTRDQTLPRRDDPAVVASRPRRDDRLGRRGKLARPQQRHLPRAASSPSLPFRTDPSVPRRERAGRTAGAEPDARPARLPTGDHLQARQGPVHPGPPAGRRWRTGNAGRVDHPSDPRHPVPARPTSRSRPPPAWCHWRRSQHPTSRPRPSEPQRSAAAYRPPADPTASGAVPVSGSRSTRPAAGSETDGR